jgi:hypothetical protein
VTVDLQQLHLGSSMHGTPTMKTNEIDIDLPMVSTNTKPKGLLSKRIHTELEAKPRQFNDREIPQI